MTAGRKEKSDIDELIALAQYHFLRLSLNMSESELSKWLKLLPEGSMNDRDALKFMQHRSTISFNRATAINRYAPGFASVTLWPWRELSPGIRVEKVLRSAGDRLALSKKLLLENPASVSTTRNSIIHPIADPELWLAAEDFFICLINYRRDERNGKFHSSPTLLLALSKALNHPLLQSIKNELAYCTDRIMPAKDILAMFRLHSPWEKLNMEHGIRRQRDFSKGMKPKKQLSE